MTKLEGKVAFITGASRGIGAAVARLLSGQRVQLGLASRSGGDLGLPDSLGVRCDVRRPQDVRSAVAATVDRFGGLDICVANAGVGAYGPFLELREDHLEEIVDVNLKGTIYTYRAALPHLLEAGEADAVTIASEAGRRGLPGEAVYCATKTGQVGLTRSLDHELRERGVRCSTICPGGVATDFAIGDGRGRTAGMPELATMMSPEDVAEAVLFVLTRPRKLRILEAAMRPISEESWG